MRADKQTDRHAHRNTPLPIGWSNNRGNYRHCSVACSACSSDVQTDAVRVLAAKWANSETTQHARLSATLPETTVTEVHETC